MDSILGIEVGAAFTKAALFDLVDGQRRVLAAAHVPTALFPPDGDVSRGALAAIERVQEIAGRPLANARGPIIPEHSSGEGVDGCFVVTSACRPLRVVLLAESGSKSSSVAAETNAVPEIALADTILLGSAGRQGKTRMSLLLDAFHRERPDVLIVAAGEGLIESALVEIGQCVVIGARDGAPRPAIIFLGPEESLVAMRKSLADDQPIYHLPSKPPPAEGFTPLQEHLLRLWQENAREDIPGWDELGGWCSAAPCSVQRGFASALRFLSSHRRTDVWGIDIGARTSWMTAVAGGHLSTRVRTNLGVGQGSLGLLSETDKIGQWLAYSRGLGAVADAVLNRYFHPIGVPESDAERLLEGALTREVARSLSSDLPIRPTHSEAPALVVARGTAISAAKSDGEAILLLLDALQPVGFAELAVDAWGILPMLGAMAKVAPDIASELLLRDGLRVLGPCVAMEGGGRDESVAAKVTLEHSGQKMVKEVHFGQIKSLPLEKGQTAKLTVSPLGKLDCGAGPGRRLSCSPVGGSIGLVIDARGRPVAPRTFGERRLERLAVWREALGA